MEVSYNLHWHGLTISGLGDDLENALIKLSKFLHVPLDEVQISKIEMNICGCATVRINDIYYGVLERNVW